MADGPIEPDAAGDYPSDMESRVAVLNARAEYRWVLGIMLGGFAGLLGVMTHGFHWL